MVILDGQTLTIEEVARVLLKGEKVSLAEGAREEVMANRQYLEKRLAAGDKMYGINTGFGHLSHVSISTEQVEDLQENLIRSHAAGVGPDLWEAAVRGVMLLRANALAKGYSGVRPVVIEILVDFLNHDVCPQIPVQGSVGASGDLVPLAHMALCLIGEGQVYHEGCLQPTDRVLKKLGIEPLRLQAKEGLALINGTQVMASLGVLALLKGMNLLRHADIISALTIEALRGLDHPFQPGIHTLRSHPGQQKVAANILTLLQGRGDPEGGFDKVQDAYSLRCIPQVHGASRDAYSHVQEVLNREMNAATDNPLIFHGEDRILSGGNFHGQPLALALDYLGIAVSELGNISERRVERLVNPALSGLDPFLVRNSGLNSGYMVVQYTAAALASENKVLATPASVDSIPTSANQEDHVSMGSISARKLHNILDNVRSILAIEALCACQGIDLAGIETLGQGTQLAYDLIRETIPGLEEDRVLKGEMDALGTMIEEQKILRCIEEAGLFLE